MSSESARIVMATAHDHQRFSDAVNFHDNMPASALDKVVTFSGEFFFFSKGNARLQSIRRRLLANELTWACQVSQKSHIHKTRMWKTQFCFQPDKTSLEFSKQIDDDCRFDQELRTGTDRKCR